MIVSPSQVGERELGTTRERVVAVEPDGQAVVQHVRVCQSGEPVRDQRKRGIELALQHLPLKVLAQRFAHLDLDRGKPLDERLGQSEPALAPARQRKPEHEPPVGLLRVPDRQRILCGLDRHARLVEQFTSRLGQLYPVRTAHEQRLADLPLELLHLARQRRLA